MEYYQKLCTKKKLIDRGKRSKRPNEVKPIENINKNPQSSLKISPMRKEVPKKLLHLMNYRIHLLS